MKPTKVKGLRPAVDAGECSLRRRKATKDQQRNDVVDVESHWSAAVRAHARSGQKAVYQSDKIFDMMST
jgi:hypothetical protein